MALNSTSPSLHLRVFTLALCISLTVGALTFLEEHQVAKKDLEFRINADNNTQMFIIFTQQRSG